MFTYESKIPQISSLGSIFYAIFRQINDSRAGTVLTIGRFEMDWPIFTGLTWTRSTAPTASSPSISRPSLCTSTNVHKTRWNSGLCIGMSRFFHLQIQGYVQAHVKKTQPMDCAGISAKFDKKCIELESLTVTSPWELDWVDYLFPLLWFYSLKQNKTLAATHGSGSRLREPREQTKTKPHKPNASFAKKIKKK